MIKSFNPKPFIEAAEMLLCADETLLALKLLDTLPMYYQDHPPKEILSLKREIMAKIATATFYAHHTGFELTVTDEQCATYSGTLRNQLILADVRRLNEAEYGPHIYDHGPGEGALPLLLKKAGCEFTYDQVYLNEPTKQATHHRFKDVEYTDKPKAGVPIIWVSTEIIEHLHCENEIRFEMEQRCFADVIHLSTPLYTFDENVIDWRKIGWLGHLRTYSPESFQAVVHKMFPEYVMAYYQSKIQHIRLVHPDTKFELLKTHYDFGKE